jgi:FMN phosphatase YigB (HAD superfamily)
MNPSGLSKSDAWPKAVFTDSKNTLWDWDPVWVKSCALMLEKYGSDMDPQEFWRLWVMGMAGENHKAAFGKYRTFTETLQIALMNAFHYAGIPGCADDVHFMNDLWDEVPPYPDTAPAIARIQEMGVPVLVYSNVETEYLDMMVAKLAPVVPAFVGDMEKSCSRKPSPFAYRWVLDTAGRELGLELDYPDILYVAGPQWDVQAAMGLGMKGCWIHRFFGPAVAEHIAREVQGVEPHYQVDSMDEVVKIVEQRT